MSLQGPIVVIARQKNSELVAALAADGAFPVVEASWRDGADAIARIEPAAVVVTDPERPSPHAAAVRAAINTARTPYLPVLARIGDAAGPALTDALPISAGAPPPRIAERLASALRVRTLHATALRRAAAPKGQCDDLPMLPASHPIEEATLVVTGR